MASTITDIPLTTVFTPRPTCSTDYVIFSGDTRSSIRQAWAFTFLVSSSSLSTNSFCEPPSISSVLRRTRQSAFSPGICPDGFTTATSSFISNTMHAYCCLDGYAIEDSLDGRYFQESATLELVQCRRYLTTSVAVQVVTAARGRTSVLAIAETTMMAPPIVVEHDALSVAWRPEELELFVGATPTLNTNDAEESLAAKSLGLGSSTVETRVTNGSSGNAPAGTDLPAANEGGGNGGLSNGAKIGVGIGAAVAVVAIILGVILSLRRRRNNVYVKEAPYGIERDGVNQMGGIDDSPAGIGGVSDSK
ncbi:hypothetical protein TWF281_004477 [Arthrobotrys megalospora]